MSARRIAVVTDALHPGLGGVQTFVEGLLDAWAARGRALVVIAPPYLSTPHPRWPLDLTRDDVPLPALAEALAERVAACRADAVVLASAGLACLAEGLEAPTLVVLHGKDLTAPWQRGVTRAQVVAALDRADARVAVSRATRSIAEQLGVTRPIEVVEPGFDLTRVWPGDRGEARDRLGLPHDRFVVGTLARLVERKGHREVIDALATLARPSLYVIAGDGPERAAIEAHAAARRVEIRLLGAIDDAQRLALLRAIDVHVLAPPPVTLRLDAPFDVEGFGLSVLEAGACGTPSLGTRSGGVPEAIGDGGLVVDDAAGLGPALARLAADDALRAALGESAARRARRHGGHAATAERLAWSLDALARARGHT